MATSSQFIGRHTSSSAGQHLALNRGANRLVAIRMRMRRLVAVMGAVVTPVMLAVPASAFTSSFVVASTPSARGSALNAIAARSATDIWAVGSYDNAAVDDAFLDPFALHFDGTAWKAVFPAGGTRFNDERLLGVAAIAANDVWAVGARKRTGFKSPVTPLALHFDGSKWVEIATPALGASRAWLTAVTSVASNDIWAVGTANSSGSTALLPLVEHWDGVSWKVVASPTPTPTSSSALLGAAATSPTNVWAVGSGGGRTLVERWQGAAWTIVPSADVPPQQPGAAVVDTLTSVTAISSTNAWAVGHAFDTVSGSGLTNRTVVEHWNGTKWSLVSAPSVEQHPQLTGVAAVGASDIWAVGSGWHDVATGVPVQHPILLHYNGASWSSVTPPANVGPSDNLLNGVTALPGGAVWAAGNESGRTLVLRRT